MALLTSREPLFFDRSLCPTIYGTMDSPKKNSTLVGLRITSLGTLVSRVLGMIRDMATAALLGMSAGGVMDAFVVAFRIPDLFRRLFGEGALTASYLPALSKKLEEDPPSAWRLASAMFAEKVLSRGVPTCEVRYRKALFHLLLTQTSCYRYWGEGIWADYGRELCRRTMEILRGEV